MTTTVPALTAETAAQIAAAHALPQLLTHTADLPRITWVIDATGWRLYGYLHHRDPVVFNAYADRIGGTITTGRVSQEDDQPVRDQQLDTTWNGVPLQISALVTEEAAA